MRPRPFFEKTNAQFPVLVSLYEAMHDGAAFAWAVEHANDIDPVPSAWAECDYEPLLNAFCIRVTGELGRCADALPAPRADWYHIASNCAECSAAVKRKLPTLTLAQVLDTWRRAT